MPPDRTNDLRSIFAPARVAVIGATDRAGSVGRSVFANLIQGTYKGDVVAVNPNRSAVLGVRSIPNIADARKPVDLAVIVTPASTVPDIVAQCADAGVGGAVIVSSGFREVGPAGVALERDAIARARRTGMRIVGPNCLGVIVPRIGLNATFAARGALAGSIGFVSQSGALCTAILDWGAGRNIGFSCFVSAGTMADLGFGDYIAFLAGDAETKSILLYVESIGDAASFVAAARAAAADKPVIVMKAGRSPAAAHAAASHTGALAESDAVLDAALRRCGVMRVETIEDLFDMADVLAKRSRPAGNRLAILTNAGGPGVIAADSLLGGGGELGTLSRDSIARFDALLPAYWSRANPIDILGDADPARYERALEVLHDDLGNDAVLVIYAPTGTAPSAEAAEAVARSGAEFSKPLYATWMGGESAAEGATLLDRSEIPTFAFPEDAVRAFNYSWRYQEALRHLSEKPEGRALGSHEAAGAAAMLAGIRSSGRAALFADESARLLSFYHIPALSSTIAASADDAVAAARRAGYPVALKLSSSVLLHKTDVGGVVLDVTGDDAVRSAFDRIRTSATAHGGSAAFQGAIVQPMLRGEGYELIVGSAIDPQFGPVIAFGLGGQLVEVFDDSALGFPPLSAALALRLMERTRIYRALRGVRGRAPVDLDELAGLLVRFAALVVDLPAIKEIDLNPLYAAPDRIAVMDARVILHDRAVPDAELPRPIIA